MKWEFWIDRGGTFTDIVARAPDGLLVTGKLLSESPGHYEDAAVEGIRRILKLSPEALIDPEQVACVKMGTTVATNALLERKGERTVLLISKGFKDALRIATQARPKLFERHIVLPELLYERVIEAEERVGAHGEIVTQFNEDLAAKALEAAFRDGIRACAIVFLHGDRFHDHELKAAALAKRVGFNQISVSHQVSPLMKLVPRGDTTVVDAYLSPILHRYTQRVGAAMPGVPLLFMQSSGGLTRADRFHGKDAILSGPAGGIVGMALTAKAAGHERVIGFDMGGTSTDVSHYAGEYERVFDAGIGGVRVRAPMMSIHTIAAGGGSIVRFDGGRLRVGPESAGANPGPRCYRRGGPLTVTDANLLLGRIQARSFPQVFGPGGDAPLDEGAVREGFAELAKAMSLSGAGVLSGEEVAAGALKIAVGSMANAVKRISVMRGHDVSAYTLQCFGGAGGQHACQVADALGMSRVFIHPLAGVLSAYGMGLADQTAMREVGLEQPLDPAGIGRARDAARKLAEAAVRELAEQGVESQGLEQRIRLHVRYAGTDTALIVDMPQVSDAGAAADEARAAFERAYRQRFAFLIPKQSLVIEAVGVECISKAHSPVEVTSAPAASQHPAAAERVDMFCFSEGPGGWQRAAFHQREDLNLKDLIEGPAVIAERNATTVVEPGWRARLTQAGGLELERSVPRATTNALGTRVDPVTLELFNNIFMNIAEQMGLRLQNTAYSVNIKERLDFSCALFDAGGDLIANAPHMPVHLGSMGESIRSVVARNPDIAAGDVYVLNDPYHGGTHLPDVTVVTPVFLKDSDAKPTFYVASRGHHADIGGTTPGSMPPFSKVIEDEGVLIDNFKLVSGGRFDEAGLRSLLGSGRHPARNADQNIADLRAQVAANEKGAQELKALVGHYGRDTVLAYMGHVKDNAEASVRRVITALKDGRFSLTLDNGAHIDVAININVAERSARIDFSGTSGQLDNNFNGPRAITTAAVLYVFRTLVDDDIPLNAGCLRPLEVIVPEGCMLNPRPPAAVVAGNVETSSCVTNALYGALGVMAAGQCTMNNFTFGNARYQYYETISGGSGAGEDFNGTSVVQTHMTNSRLTDPEVLEFRFPVRLESYEIRHGSGGSGRHQGGEGGDRRIRFLEKMTASILSNGRKYPAFGMAGGEPGALGENWIERADGRNESLSHIAEVEVSPGDTMVIRTPGGGGFGKISR